VADTTKGRFWTIALTAVIAVAGYVSPAPGQTGLQLRWELVEDVFGDVSPRGASRVAFTLTNGGAAVLPASGWAIYFNTMARPAAVLAGGVSLEFIHGDYFRLVPGPGFRNLGPGESARVEYLTRNLVSNIGQAPSGPYIVFTSDPTKGHPVDYVVVPFARPPQQGRDPRVISPEAQYAANEILRDVPPDDLPLAFPTPLQVTRGPGRLRLVDVPAVSAPPALAAEASLVRKYLGGALTPRARASSRQPEFRLTIGAVSGQDSPEAYELVIDATGVRLTGQSAAGVFYGIQTIRSLLPAARADELSLPALRIVDAPRFEYRGLMLDVARNFQPKETVLFVLELMARYKLNTLHFHLTDDEGWRLAIPALPELTAVGARRGHAADPHRMLEPAYGSGPDPDRPFGSGFYTRSDYIEILRSARALRIDVIPEIEMPGHARAAIKAMEARFHTLQAAGDAAAAGRFRLIDPGDRSVYVSAQQYRDNVMNPALESTYAFIDTVVGDIARMHREAGAPLTHLHAGGDEVPAGVWELSPAAQTYRQDQALASVRDLWFPFYARVERILASHGATPAGWEEIAIREARAGGQRESVPNPQFANRNWLVYVWNNLPGGGAEDLAYRLANGGYRVVLTPVTNLYFDLAYNKNPEERGLNWGGYVDVDKPYQFIPLDYYRSMRDDRFGNPLDKAVFTGKARLSAAGQRNIVGIQGNLWSETLGMEGRLDAMLLPKLFGLAERAWAPDPDWAGEADDAATRYREAWSTFASVIGTREIPRLLLERPGLRYRIPTPGLRVTSEGNVLANLQLPGFVLRYTTDGSEPTVASPAVRGPIRASGPVTVAAFDATGRRGFSARVAVGR
jgi:hexosaminidase